jgi:hypothetical protein
LAVPSRRTASAIGAIRRRRDIREGNIRTD